MSAEPNKLVWKFEEGFMNFGRFSCTCGSKLVEVERSKEDGVIVKCAVEGCTARVLMADVIMGSWPPANPSNPSCVDCGEEIAKDDLGRWRHVKTQYRHPASPSRFAR